MTKPKIIPTLLVKNSRELKRKVSKLGSLFSLAQLDIMDGQFVKNKTLHDFQKINTLTKKLKLESHLMVRDPLSYVQELRKYPRIIRYIVHVETVNEKMFDELYRLCCAERRELALAINPKSSIKKYHKLLSQVPRILIMGVIPGHSGRKLLTSTYARVRDLRALYPRATLSLDGGINQANATKLLALGITNFNMSSYLYRSHDIAKSLKQLFS